MATLDTTPSTLHVVTSVLSTLSSTSAPSLKPGDLDRCKDLIKPCGCEAPLTVVTITFVVVSWWVLTVMGTMYVVRTRTLNRIRTTKPEHREEVMKAMRIKHGMDYPDLDYMDPKDVLRVWGGKA